jgi:Protein of unknown function (DUF1573)
MAQEWAQKMFKSTSHDFGTVARGAKVEFPFDFENIYLEDLHISSVRSSCGCTSVEYPHEIVKTYGKGTVKAVVDTRAFLGEKRATLTVVFDKPFAAEVPLQIHCYIRRDIVFKPGVVRFRVRQGEKASQKILITYAGRDDWKINSVKSPFPYIETKLVEIARGNGQVSYELWVGLTKDAPANYLSGQLILETNDLDANKCHVPLAIEGQVVTSLSVRPDSLTFLSMSDGAPMKRNLFIQGSEPFRVVSADCADSRIEVTLPTESKRTHLVPVNFLPDAKVGKANASLLIKTDQGGQIQVGIITEILPPEASSEKLSTIPGTDSEPTEAKPTDAKQTDSDSNEANQAESEQAESEQAESEQAESEQAESEQAESDSSKPDSKQLFPPVSR